MMKRIAIILAIVASTAQGLNNRLALTVNCKKTAGVGQFYFDQASPNSPIEITGEMHGVNPGQYYVYIHDKNDTSNRCDSMGPISENVDGQLYHVFTVNIPEGGPQAFTVAPGPLTLDEIVDHGVAFHWPPTYENGEKTVDPTTLGCGVIKSSPHSSIQDPTTSTIPPQRKTPDPTPSSVDRTTEATPLENASENRLVLTINCKKTPGVGTFYFTQASPQSPIQITGEMHGVNPGQYYVYIHDKNDTSNRCDSMGPISENVDGQLYHVFTVNIPEGGPQAFTVAPGPLTLDEIVDHGVAFHWPPTYENGEKTVDPTTLGCGVIKADSQSSPPGVIQPSTTNSTRSQSEIQDSTTSRTPSHSEIQNSTTSRTSLQGEVQDSATISTSPKSVYETNNVPQLVNAYETEHRLLLTINSNSVPNIGKVYFTQANPTAPVRITGDFDFLPGVYYAYIHNENDVTNHCHSIGSISRNSNGLYHVFTASIPEDGPRTLTMAPGQFTLDDIANRAIGLHWVFLIGHNNITPHPQIIACGIVRKEIEESLENATQESTTVSQISGGPERTDLNNSRVLETENTTTISAQSRTEAVPLPDERVMSVPSCPVPLQESTPIDVLVSRQANETCVSNLCYRKLCCKMDAMRTITCRPLTGSEC